MSAIRPKVNSRVYEYEHRLLAGTLSSRRSPAAVLRRDLQIFRRQLPTSVANGWSQPISDAQASSREQRLPAFRPSHRIQQALSFHEVE